MYYLGDSKNVFWSYKKFYVIRTSTEKSLYLGFTILKVSCILFRQGVRIIWQQIVTLLKS